MMSYPTINLVDSVIDEVSLEGLDGITLEALWKRLSYRLQNPLPFTEQFMIQIWSLCVQIREFTFYELKTEREPLIVFDRYQYVDPDLGIILEPENTPPDIYPHCPISDIANGIKGSCSTYYTRKQVTEVIRNLSFNKAVKQYGQKLVIVASQSARNHALMGDGVPPILELNVIQYCFLERVGRSRYHGEVTQGKLSLSALKEDPKSLFYHRKFLLRHKLITKQIHHQKSGGHCFNGSLLHLPRFYVERKPKIIFLAEEVIKILKSKPNCVAEYDEIKRKLQIEHVIKKLFKTSFFQKVVKTDIKVPYRTLYPNAKPIEWQLKNNPSKEKKIKVVQLLSPDIDILEAWSKDEIQEDDETHELSISNHKYGVPYLKQANTVIEASGDNGLCQGGLCRIMGLTKLQSRTIFRNLVKANIVATYMNDIGRQRLTKYVSKKYEKGSKLSKEFKREMCKIKEFTKQVVIDTSNVEEGNNIEEIIDKREENTTIVDQNESIQKNNDANYVTEPEEPTVTGAQLQKIFNVVNRILLKYHIIKRPKRYKQTFNYLSNKNNKITSKEKGSNNKTLQVSNSSMKQKESVAYKNIKVELTVLKVGKTNKTKDQIFGFMEDVQNNRKKNISNITYRLLKRANLIIESIKQHQVVDDMTKLLKMIHEEEDKEGYDVKIDKKSLIRLLQKLAKDNLIKNIRLTLSGNGKEKHTTFICDPNIDVNSSIIQSAVEQAKLKFYLIGSHRSKLSLTKPKVKLEPTEDTDATDILNTDEDNQSVLNHLATFPPNFKYGARLSRKYGYSPKFVRMQTLHIFLFYLIYEHPGEQTLSRADQIQALRNKDLDISEELIEEFGTVYSIEDSWKMFVPPLPKYNGWPTGWALMCDILLRLPLSIFLKLHYICYGVPEIEKYIDHPVRRHYLVRDLPGDIRNSLMYARKYIFNIHETMTRLCYIGLIQFGPQKLKEKDQVFIYLNCRTELMDTTSSAPSYHMIQDKPYPVTKYNFTDIQTVEKYWNDMWNICINTPLGGRLVVQGKDIILEDLTKKSDMIQAIVARAPDEAVKFDTGKMPGDRKGAAGIDSACFAHLKRNWNWGISSYTPQMKKKQNEAPERTRYLSKIKAKPLKFTEFSGLKTVCGPHSVNVTEFKKQVQNKTDEISNLQKKYETFTFQRTVKQKSYVRRVLPRKSSSRRRTKYDEVDYRALQRMHKLRVDWESHEDKILLVCKIAMMYLCSSPRKQVITFSTVRDVLRTYSFDSHNKTSRACQRRLLYMLRQQRNVDIVALGVEELKQNFFIKKRFDGIVEKLKQEHKGSHEYEKQITEAFKQLVAYVANKYYDISDASAKELVPLPKTAQEFNLLYKIVHPTKPFSNRGFTKDVRNVNDILSAIVNSVIHSSMCCGKDRRSWAYQLFKVYQQYPEMLLRNAMAKIRSDQMVSVKKHHLTILRKYGNYMPMSSSQYQLSNHYIYKFQTKWPYDVFKESYDVLLKLSNWYCHNQKDNHMNESINFNGIEVLPITGGVVGAIHDYIIQDQIDFDVEIPDQVIMLDPRLKEKDETYFRIAQRYQDVLASLDSLNFVNEFSLRNSDADTSKQYNNSDKCFDSGANILNDNNMHNISVKLGKDDADKNIASEEPESKKRKVELTINEDLIFDSDEENYSRNILNDEQNVIKLQDGTKIVLDEADLKHSKFNDDDSMTEVKDNVSFTAEISKESIVNKKLKIPGTEQVSQPVDMDKTDNILDTKSNYLEDKLIPSRKIGLKRNGDKELNSDLPLKKRIQSDNETIGTVISKIKSEEFQRNNVILNDISTEIQNKDLRNHTNDEIVEMTNAKLNTDDIENKKKKRVLNEGCEISSQLKKTHKNNFTRVSDILKNISFEQNYLNSYCKLDDSGDVHKRYTRIALLRMRQELHELTAADSHHAHEYFVVNMFKVFYSLNTLKSPNSTENEMFRGLSLPRELLPLSLSTANDLIQEISKFAVFPKDGISYSDFKQKLPNDFPVNLNNMDIVHKYVRDRKEIGASIQELTDEFKIFSADDLYSITSLLTENRIFLRAGVTHVRYIHYRYADAWLIRSYKIYRLERESLVPIPSGTVYLTESKKMEKESNDMDIAEDSNKNLNSLLRSESSSTIDKDMTEVDNKWEPRNQENEGFNKNKSSHSDEECGVQVKKRMQRKRTRLLPQKDISRAAKQLDLNTKQEVRVVIKPWIRIDGVLNRRVFDRMLGSVLSYCLMQPGIALTKVQTRFVPVLQPCHTRELIEILIKLGCLRSIILEKPRVTLFSKPSPVKQKVANNNWSVEEDIFLEPTNTAILKFGIFLSTKMYSTDFIT